MPIHDWTRVEPGIFHHFHQEWISKICASLNSGLLPPGFYALEEQVTGDFGPDVLTLQVPSNGPADTPPPGGHPVAVATAPPQVWYRTKAEIDIYAAKANVIRIRHTSDHRVIAVVEIVSPGNKRSKQNLFAFVDKAEAMIRNGIHLLVIDVFPPSTRDPQGIHREIWNRIIDNDFVLPADRPLTLASYSAGLIQEAFVEPTRFGAKLIDMPVFLTPAEYISVPLEPTYQAAWEAVPAFWRNFLSNPAS